MDTSKKPRLVLQHMSKHFDTVKAVEDVSFSVFPGEVRGLIGENGSGKSTLSAMICGSLKPNNGSMELDGQPYHPRSILDARSKGVAILLQERGTIDGMTVAENMFIGMEDDFKGRIGINREKCTGSQRRSWTGSAPATFTPASWSTAISLRTASWWRWPGPSIPNQSC